MKRLARILARLYPAAWRKRYGAEFEALIEDARPGLGGALDILKGALSMQLTSWTPLRILAVSVIAGVVIAIGIGVRMPKRWSSAAVIQVEPGPQDGKSVDRVNAVTQAVFKRASLTKIMIDHDLYRNNLKSMTIEDVLEVFKGDIQISPVSRANGTAFQVRFVYEDPRQAKQVVETLVDNFITNNLARAQADQDHATTFRVVEVASLADKPTNPSFSAKFATAGAAGGFLIGGPIAAFLYWRRRK